MVLFDRVNAALLFDKLDGNSSLSFSLSQWAGSLELNSHILIYEKIVIRPSAHCNKVRADLARLDRDEKENEWKKRKRRNESKRKSYHQGSFSFLASESGREKKGKMTTRKRLFGIFGAGGVILACIGGLISQAWVDVGIALLGAGGALLIAYIFYFWGIGLIRRYLIPHNFQLLAWIGLSMLTIGLFGAAYMLMFDISDLITQAVIAMTVFIGLLLWGLSLRLSLRKARSGVKR